MPWRAGTAGSPIAECTAYVTLEPCGHTGKTGPCADALIAAGITRVVFARHDPHDVSGGGASKLQAAGIEVSCTPCPEAQRVSDPFCRRVTQGLPSITCKWAQTLDGKIATRSGHSQWISNETSRRVVHRIRSRMDAIITGIGTVMRDDPLLTARLPAGRPPKRVALRIVFDPAFDIPHSCQLVQTSCAIPVGTPVRTVDTMPAGRAPTIVCISDHAYRSQTVKVDSLSREGVTVIAIPEHGRTMPSLEWVARELVRRYEVTNILVEAGGGLTGTLLKAKLVGELHVFIGPRLLADDRAIDPARMFQIEHIQDGTELALRRARVLDGDVELKYRVVKP
ncbi:MAG: bifunctional diaminohydroxyphosphoribosylaminopyrimidine deaminase/5-amino-6-(5-phosphoribosylamino)uracil reductase RibD [Planctomycetes bacterium]|nr:bifunctional diaminohydroxyphosphoribosylaminopyrimidine deaminase/5-amino-6-(5-phosphoribosylamino)uracil reductase RibD [Planctomycetota bacterium]